MFLQVYNTAEMYKKRVYMLVKHRVGQKNDAGEKETLQKDDIQRGEVNN